MTTDCTSDLLTDPANKQIFRRKLVAWYGKHARELAWRRDRDPYRIWLSEVMLQQTTVAAVGPYFERFIRAFPTVEALAAADEQQVLRLWEGLGYYRRARALHAAAKVIVAEHRGVFPQDVPALMTLPGVGRYTSGAIASFAFDRPAPIVEANTQRVLSRLAGFRGETSTTAGQRFLWQTAESLVPRRGAGRFNYALMELGALVCTPADPKCDACPVRSHCAACDLGLQHEVPRLALKPKITPIHEAAVLIRKNGAVLLRQCGERERWAGLWDFPRFELKKGTQLISENELHSLLIAKVREQTGLVIEPGAFLKTIKHAVTRYRITLDCYAARAIGNRICSTDDRPIRWTPLSDLANTPLSATGRKLAGLVSPRPLSEG